MSSNHVLQLLRRPNLTAAFIHQIVQESETNKGPTSINLSFNKQERGVLKKLADQGQPGTSGGWIIPPY